METFGKQMDCNQAERLITFFYAAFSFLLLFQKVAVTAPNPIIEIITTNKQPMNGTKPMSFRAIRPNAKA